MQKVLTGENLDAQLSELPPEAHLWIYCGFDAAVPQEILPQILERLDPQTRSVYEFELMMTGMALSMSLTGVLTDDYEILRAKTEFETKQKDLESYVQSLFVAFWGKGVNVRSPTQMADFFYYSPDGLQVTKQTKRRKKGSSVTTDRDALEKIARENYYVRPLVSAILELKEVQKKLEFLNRGVDSDGHVRCTFSAASTETGRWSSYKNPWGRGGNFQNQTEEIRKIYKPDPDYIYLAPDLKQAESFGVAYFSGDENYLAALHSGDLHTTVARMVWPGLPWAGDSGPLDREVADRKFYRHFSYRDMSKRGGHGSNYLGTAYEMAKNLKLPTEVLEQFQSDYFGTFAKIPLWHQEVQRRLQSEGFLVSPLGRKRTFFGRLYHNDTLKEAVASLPQGLISDIFKIGLYKIWKVYEAPYGQEQTRPVRVLADVHDGGLIAVRTDWLDKVAADVIRFLTIPVQMPAGVMTIPVELSVGWRWQKKQMVEWKPGILDELQPGPDSAFSLLELDAALIRA